MTAATLQATAPEPLDLGHLVPDEVWAAIVAGATDRAAVLEQPQVGMGAVGRTITARSHGGAMAGGPRLGVVHSAETPLVAGYAYSIAANWFATKATTSATVMIDPAETIRLLPDDVVAYHCGPKANGFTVGAEQAGYARLSRAEWLTPAGRAQMRQLAEYMVECRRRWGIPLRWATDAQIRAAAAGGTPQGWCFHDDIRRVFPGSTTHSDPMPNYPADELMALALSLTETEDEDMNAPQAMALAECHWMLEQMKPVLDGVSVLLSDEDAQTDLLQWALTDQDSGVRTQLAGVVGEVAGLAAAVNQVAAGSSGSSLDLEAVKAAAAAGTRSVFAELGRTPDAPVTAARLGAALDERKQKRADLAAAVQRLLAGPQPGELDELAGVAPAPPSA